MTACPQTVLATGPDEHLRAALGLVSPVPVVEVPVAEAAGLVLARDVRAPEFLPAFDNAAMDGYAVRQADRVRFAPAVLGERGGRPVVRECGNAHRLGAFAGADGVMRVDAGPGVLGTDASVPVLRL